MVGNNSQIRKLYFHPNVATAVPDISDASSPVRLTPVDAIMGLMRGGGQEVGQLQLVAQLELGVETTSSHSACSSQWFLWLFASFVGHALGRSLMLLDKVLYPAISCFYANFAFGTHHTTIISNDKCLSWIEHPNLFQLHCHTSISHPWCAPSTLLVLLFQKGSCCGLGSHHITT